MYFQLRTLSGVPLAPARASFLEAMDDKRRFGRGSYGFLQIVSFFSACNN